MNTRSQFSEKRRQSVYFISQGMQSQMHLNVFVHYIHKSTTTHQKLYEHRIGYSPLTFTQHLITKTTLKQ